MEKYKIKLGLIDIRGSDSLIQKINLPLVDIDNLVKEFDLHIKHELLPNPINSPIQKYHHLIFNNEESSLYLKVPHTANLINFIKTKYNFKDVTYRSLLPTRSYSWHKDKGKVCIHVPLITNIGCRFVYEDVSFFMPADGSIYQVYNFDYHTFVNAGTSPRVHIMFENL